MMMKLVLGYFFMITSTFMIYVHSYHNSIVDNVQYDCWPNGAGEDAPTISCAGLGMVWLIEPPSNIEINKKFNLSYMVTATDMFYQNQGNFFPNKTEQYIRELCMLNDTCPEDLSLTTADNCCIWHGRVHSCTPSLVASGRVCGPWIGHQSSEFNTHTETAQVGKIGQNFFTKDSSIIVVGLNFLIVHTRIGNVQLVLGKSIRVIPSRVCGDGLCTAEIGEDCESCPTDCCGLQFPLAATISIVILCSLIPAIIIISFIGWQGYQKRKNFYNESWVINYEDIKRDTQGPRIIISMRSMRLGSTSEIGSAEGGYIKQIFIQTGLYEGNIVAIKKMPRQDIAMNNTIRREVMQIRRLHHINLCKFVGATLKSPGNLCIITEYCHKGSLNDVLQNEDIPLNWGFRFSFIYDIANGMNYLHDHKVYHGRLSSSNCTIDDRWVVKIADYGLMTFREKDEGAFDWEAIGGGTTTDVYDAPEIRGLDKSLIIPTPEADVYSYSIILIEVATRWDPFSNNILIDDSGKPKFYTSSFSTADFPCSCSHEYLYLVEKCWAHLPNDRFSFNFIKKIILRINPDRENPVDNMMIMMNKYSKHLETLVTERTQELIAEQHKTASLLYSMLPRQIADDLKQGRTAPPTNFECATIFFSDIVEFTFLASRSTPLEIVTLLNELYSLFDDVMDSFDAYKVETIGDAYMVVSGVPQKNEDRHAGEIARLALSFLDTCDKFTIPHFPDQKLEIRIGIHSGPVCSGVVGLKMPRYCLFGDTVNTASRMESTSEAMKIHCSDKTHQLLKSLGTFKLEPRGHTAIKGKGLMKTWWLLGQEDSLTDITLQDASLNNINGDTEEITYESCHEAAVIQTTKHDETITIESPHIADITHDQITTEGVHENIIR